LATSPATAATSAREAQEEIKWYSVNDHAGSQDKKHRQLHHHYKFSATKFIGGTKQRRQEAPNHHSQTQTDLRNSFESAVTCARRV